MKKYITESFAYTIIINRSTFIAYLGPVRSKDDFETVRKELPKLYKKATHYTYGSLIDSLNFARSSDDKEPPGSAGKEILNALEEHEVDEAALFVVRYYGGTKLGLGGLTRAYREAAHGVIGQAVFHRKIRFRVYEIRAPYDTSDQVIYELESKSFLIRNKVYGEDVKLTVLGEGFPEETVRKYALEYEEKDPVTEYIKI